MADPEVAFIPIGISTYGDAAAFPPLMRVDSDIALLRALFTEPLYRELGYVAMERIDGTAGQITDRLDAEMRVLGSRRGHGLLVLWSGHGQYVEGEGLRLACSNDGPPMSGRGFSPAELVRKLRAAGRAQLVIILDVCHAGEATAAAVAAAAESINAQVPTAEKPGVSLLLASRAAGDADDGRLVPLLVQVLQRGPSVAAMARFDAQGFGFWSERSRRLTMSELRETLRVEAEVMAAAGLPVPVPTGNDLFTPVAIFPNPLYKPQLPAEAVDAARRRMMRETDAVEHFLPKAGGTGAALDDWFFTGRVEVNRELVSWLAEDDPPDDDVFVLTGSAGSGKSAIIGRLVALSDADGRRAVQRAGWYEAADGSEGTIPEVGSICAALHLRQLSLEEAVSELGTLLGVEASDPADIEEALDELSSGADRAPVICLDALDEAVDPIVIASELVPRLVGGGARVLVATRRTAARATQTRLVDELNPRQVIDLADATEVDADITAYAAARLVATHGSPFDGRDVADPDVQTVTAAVSRHAEGNFLYAKLVTDALVRRSGPVELVAGWEANLLPASVGEALSVELSELDRAYRVRFGSDRPAVTELLSALAWAEGRGLPLADGTWAAVGSAVSSDESEFAFDEVSWVLHTAGRFIVESEEDEQAVYRLFHERLVEHFLGQVSADERVESQRRIVNGLLRLAGDPSGATWVSVTTPYLLRHGSTHMAEAGEIDRYLVDAGFLVHADPPTLLGHLTVRGPSSPAAEAVACYLLAFGRLVSADRKARTSYLGLAALRLRYDWLASSLGDLATSAPWTPRRIWSGQIRPRKVLPLVRRGRQMELATAQLDGRAVLACADETQLRLLDLADGSERWVDGSLGGPVRNGCLVVAAPWLVAGTANGLRVHELASGSVAARPAKGVTALAVNPRSATLAVGYADGRLELRDLSTLELRRVLEPSHAEAVSSLAFLSGADSGAILLSTAAIGRRSEGPYTGQVRLWDAQGGLVLDPDLGQWREIEWGQLVYAQGSTVMLLRRSFGETMLELRRAKDGSPISAVEHVSVDPFAVELVDDRIRAWSGFADSIVLSEFPQLADGGAPLTHRSIGVAGGGWTGPVDDDGERCFVSVRNDVRTWSVQHLIAEVHRPRAGAVGEIDETGEGLFWACASAEEEVFSGCSRLGNLRRWTQDGDLLELTQLVTNLYDADIPDRMTGFDFEGQSWHVTVSGAGLVRWVRASDGSERSRFRTPHRPTAIAHLVLGDEPLLVIAGEAPGMGPNDVRVWSLVSGTEMDTSASGRAIHWGRSAQAFSIVALERKNITQVAAHTSREGTLLAGSCRTYYDTVVWDFEERKELWRRTSDSEVRALVFAEHEGDTRLVIGHENGMLEVRSARGGRSLHTAQLPSDAMAIVPTERGALLVASGSSLVGFDGRLDRWLDIDLGVPINAVATLPSGRTMAATDDGFVLLDLRQP